MLPVGRRPGVRVKQLEAPSSNLKTGRAARHQTRSPGSGRNYGRVIVLTVIGPTVGGNRRAQVAWLPSQDLATMIAKSLSCALRRHRRPVTRLHDLGLRRTRVHDTDSGLGFSQCTQCHSEG